MVAESKIGVRCWDTRANIETATVWLGRAIGTYEMPRVTRRRTAGMTTGLPLNALRGFVRYRACLRARINASAMVKPHILRRDVDFRLDVILGGPTGLVAGRWHRLISLRFL